MANDQIHIIARIRFLDAHEGGRSYPVKGGTSYRPNHSFFEPEDDRMCIGWIDVPEGSDVEPGDTIEVPITMWIWPELESEIRLGREWRVQEGARVVAIGTVLKVVC
jgi:elongation factor Tu